MFDLDSSHLTNFVKRNGFVRFVSRFDKIDDVQQSHSGISVSPSLKLTALSLFTALSEAHRRWVVDCAPASWIEVAFRGLECLLVDRSGGFRRTGVGFGVSAWWASWWVSASRRGGLRGGFRRPAWWASWWVSASRRGGLRGVFRRLGVGSGVSAWWVSASRCGFRRTGEVGFGVPASTAPILVTPLLNMQSIRISVLRHVRVSGSAESWLLAEKQNVLKQLSRQMCSSTVTCPDQIMDRVIGLVKKFDKIDASKVTKTADFQKDLSLDSLDRVELIMAFEQEFSLDIPDEKADKLTCCADVAKYIVSGAEQKVVEES
ncbi:hypothetical protein CMV_014508 [Castanea mollissima]|uniref:Acyl carrier protein n=1 Tax=Castanea mollissima TaxID=60419 RepID=A0A8J4VKY1_9ROSI|nr:hypothetical protein CMV_014508 [Castanea mollissima]